MTAGGRNEAVSPVICERNDFHIHAAQRREALLQQIEQVRRQQGNLTGLRSELIAFTDRINHRGAVWPGDGKQQHEWVVIWRLSSGQFFANRTPPARVNRYQTAA